MYRPVASSALHLHANLVILPVDERTKDNEQVLATDTSKDRLNHLFDQDSH